MTRPSNSGPRLAPRAVLGGILAGACLWTAPLRASAAVALTALPVKAKPAIDETNASAGSGHLAWDQESTQALGHFDEFAQVGGSTIKVNQNGTQGMGGGIDGSTLIFEQITGSDDNIMTYNFATGRRTPVRSLNTWSGRQVHPTISGRWVLLDRQKSGGLSTVILFNRRTHGTRTIAKETVPWRFVYAGQVAGDYAVWGEGTPKSWDVFLYNIAKRTSRRIPRPSWVSFQYMPTVTADGSVYFARGGRGCGTNVRIMRRHPRGTARKLVALPDLVDVGYMYAFERQDGTTTLFFNRSRCKDRADYVPHPWDVYKIEDANASR
jgi:hypothetical protein